MRSKKEKRKVVLAEREDAKVIKMRSKKEIREMLNFYILLVHRSEKESDFPQSIIQHWQGWINALKWVLNEEI